MNKRGQNRIILFVAALLAFAAPDLAQTPKVERVFAAGPPASVLVFAIAPEKLVGWTRGMRPNEAQFFEERYARLPELGRLTGRGDTANVEVVLDAKADLIVAYNKDAALLRRVTRALHEFGFRWTPRDRTTTPGVAQR